MNIIDHIRDLVIINNNYAPILKFNYLILSHDLKPSILLNFKYTNIEYCINSFIPPIHLHFKNYTYIIHIDIITRTPGVILLFIKYIYE